MAVRRRFLVFALAAAALWYAKSWAETHVETVTLHIHGGVTDHFTTLFVVDDPPYVWVRAERPGRLWLASLRANSNVDLQRGAVSTPYVAYPDETARPRVSRLFREKYGVIDQLAELLWQRDDVPIRLEPSDDVAFFE